MLINRRQLLGTMGLLALSPRIAMAAGQDRVARVYYEVLLRHTRWAETQYDPTAGRYRRTDFGFAVVLGNAVLLTRGARTGPQVRPAGWSWISARYGPSGTSV